jgi:Cupin-like domain
MSSKAGPMLRNTPSGIWARANTGMLMTARQVLKSPYALMPVQDRLIFKPLHGAARDGDNIEETELTRVRPGDITPAEFRRWAREHGPLVVEGLALDSDACRKWSVEYFREHYGDFELLITNPDQSVHLEKLGPYLDDIIAEKSTGRYVQNTADIFNQRPELEAQLPMTKLRELVGDLGTLSGSQLFLGGKNTGTSYHCARNFNCFVMVHGQKEWRFVDPRYTAWMYPFMPPSGLFAFSPVPAFEQAQRFPLYRRIPKFRTILKPGDMMVNPPWWWHAVKNLTPSSIAVATRWVTKLSGNRFFDFLSLLSHDARERNKRLGRGERLNDATNLALFHLEKLGYR